MSDLNIKLKDGGNTLYPQTKTTNLLKDDGSKDTVWTQGSLQEGENIEIVRKVNPDVISDATLFVWHGGSTTPDYVNTSVFTSGTVGLTKTSSTGTTGGKWDLGSFNTSNTGSWCVSYSGPEVKYTTGAITVDYWMIATGYGVKCIAGGIGSVDLWNNSGGTNLSYSINASGATSISGSTTLTSSWSQNYHHIALTLDLTHNTFSVYVDGKYIDSLGFSVGEVSHYVSFSSAANFAIFESYNFPQNTTISEIRVSLGDLYEQKPYKVPVGPYEASSDAGYYVINNTLKAGTNISISNTGAINNTLDISGKLDATTAAETYLAKTDAAATYATKADVLDKQNKLTAGTGIELDESGESAVISIDDTVWTNYTLQQGTNIEIAKKQNKYVIGPDTIDVLHLDGNLESEKGVATASITSPSALQNIYAKFGSGAARVKGTNTLKIDFSHATDLSTIPGLTIDFWTMLVGDDVSKNSLSLGVGYTHGNMMTLYYAPDAALTLYARGTYAYAGKDFLNSWEAYSWHHWAVTYKVADRTMHVFVDGKHIAQATASSDLEFDTYNLIRLECTNGYDQCIDEVRITKSCLWDETSDFSAELPTEPYSASAEADYYVINASFPGGTTGQFLQKTNDGVAWADVQGGGAPTVLKFKNFQGESDGEGHIEYPNFVDTGMDLSQASLVRVYLNGLYVMEDDESWESGESAEALNDYSIVDGSTTNSKILFKSAFTENTKVIVEVL